jgi:hypothetical protein
MEGQTLCQAAIGAVRLFRDSRGCRRNTSPPTGTFSLQQLAIDAISRSRMKRRCMMPHPSALSMATCLAE